VEIISREGKTFIRLTEKGALEALLAKAGVEKKQKWDGKWRVCIYDIPQSARLQRDRFRMLLKQHGFRKLQGSVFIHPFSLNREAISYLQQSGLIKYIRFLKVEEMDNDQDLRKFFKL
jgi:CRISPR-associated endonuclease Cas2